MTTINNEFPGTHLADIVEHTGQDMPNTAFPTNVFVASEGLREAMNSIPAPVKDDTNDLVTSKEAIALLGVTGNNFRQLVFHKKLPTALREGRRAMYRRVDVMELAEKRRK
jgi:hypothetical protein